MTTTLQINYSQYLTASFYGAMRGLVGLPLEHPFDVSKTFWQANPTHPTSLSVVKAIYHRGGIKGFYSGAVPNGIRLTGKQVYRWPMMLAIPPAFERLLPKQVKETFPASKKILTGLTIANFEVFVITPLERMKVWYITQNPNEKKIKYLFSAEKTEGIMKICFRGLNAVWSRQVVSWVSFLAADAKFKQIERKKHLDQQELPFGSLMKVSFFVGTVNTACNMPFDVTKTHLQKAHPKDNLGVFMTMKTIAKEHGLQALYRGWPIRMSQYILHSAFTVTVLEQLEQHWKS